MEITLRKTEDLRYTVLSYRHEISTDNVDKASKEETAVLAALRVS